MTDEADRIAVARLLGREPDGAFEVVVASDKSLALMREFEQPAQLSVHHLIAELYDGIDWVLVEGFKESDLLKIEVWRAAAAKPAGPEPTTATFLPVFITGATGLTRLLA